MADLLTVVTALAQGPFVMVLLVLAAGGISAAFAAEVTR